MGEYRGVGWQKISRRRGRSPPTILLLRKLNKKNNVSSVHSAWWVTARRNQISSWNFQGLRFYRRLNFPFSYQAVGSDRLGVPTRSLQIEWTVSSVGVRSLSWSDWYSFIFRITELPSPNERRTTHPSFVRRRGSSLLRALRNVRCDPAWFYQRCGLPCTRCLLSSGLVAVFRLVLRWAVLPSFQTWKVERCPRDCD